MSLQSKIEGYEELEVRLRKLEWDLEVSANANSEKAQSITCLKKTIEDMQMKDDEQKEQELLNHDLANENTSLKEDKGKLEDVIAELADEVASLQDKVTLLQKMMRRNEETSLKFYCMRSVLL